MVGVVLAQGNGGVLLPQRHRLHRARLPAHHRPARPRSSRGTRRARPPAPRAARPPLVMFSGGKDSLALTYAIRDGATDFFLYNPHRRAARASPSR